MDGCMVDGCGWTDGWLMDVDGWMREWMDGRVDGWTGGWVDDSSRLTKLRYCKLSRPVLCDCYLRVHVYTMVAYASIY